MNKLLKDAIADAKAVRETALANAKVALEEAFAPKLQSMLSHKIKEEMEDEEDAETPAEEETTEVARMQKMAGLVSEEGDEEETPAEEEPSKEETPAEEESHEDEPAEDEESYEDESEISDEDLEEILRELEGEDEESTEEEPKTEDVTDDKPEFGKGDYAGEPDDVKEGEKSEKGEESEEDEDIDLEEIIKALREEDEEDKEEAPAKEEEKVEEVKAELNEAYSVIKFLRGKLNEVNLLNAKLLFVNKLFKKSELTEAQKVKIIETFDRAKNVREAKLIYATLSESVARTTKTAAPKKTKMTEGFASALQKKTQIISESNDIANRFKSLVNYNK